MDLGEVGEEPEEGRSEGGEDGSESLSFAACLFFAWLGLIKTLTAGARRES